ncbi:MAG TPA: bifunctional precorrin-2 dehydrogenase/sirohydrochlorin ferrochelatase, partial [Nitrospiria bacterium]
TKNLDRFGKNGAIRHRKRLWRPADLKNAMLILAATNDRTANSEIARLADFRTRLVNAVDDPDRCSFIAPAILTRGDLIVAISTSGQSPALAKKLRGELKRTIGPEYGKYLKLLARIRNQVQARVPSIEKRRRILNRLAESDLLTWVRRGGKLQIRKRIERIRGMKGIGIKI